MCLSFWIFPLHLIVYYFNVIFSEASKWQESSTCLQPTPYSVSQTPITIFMETIRFLMKVNAVQVRIFGKGQVNENILMNRLFNHNDVFAGLNVHDAEIRYAFVGVLLWLSRLRIWCCHCCGLGHCCGMSLIPGSGTSTFHECGKEGEHSCFGCFGGKNYTFLKKKKNNLCRTCNIWKFLG